MLEAALKFRKAFSRMRTLDFLAYFNELEEEYHEDENLCLPKVRDTELDHR